MAGESENVVVVAGPDGDENGVPAHVEEFGQPRVESPIDDGNKRLGWLATAVFLELNGASVSSATSNEVYDLVLSVAAGDVALERLAESLRRLGGVELD